MSITGRANCEIGHLPVMASVLAIASVSRDPKTLTDVAAVPGGFLKEIAAAFAKVKPGSGDGCCQRSLASTLADPKRLEAEIDIHRHPRLEIPAGMPIGDAGWFDDVLSE
ncbi:hypothetical protein SCLO_1025540 [Sphingobium cloacae]|uniref:Uncharacterized protein n=3 Tax=Sphingobium cloacae TaxID=120107 RepID=A0A1E1F4Z5_9SPHN|nr:hypothetical protein SCLO_1025540 [Sphingobium cloacae]